MVMNLALCSGKSLWDIGFLKPIDVIIKSFLQPFPLSKVALKNALMCAQADENNHKEQRTTEELWWEKLLV